MGAVANVRRRGSRSTVLEAEVLQDDRVIAFTTGTLTAISRLTMDGSRTSGEVGSTHGPQLALW